MDSAPNITDEMLLDYLLEQCDPPESSLVAAALEQDEQVAARFARMQGTLAPLDTWTTPPPPAGMVSDILDNIAAHDARAVLRGEEPGPSLAPSSVEEVGPGRGRIISLREVLALAACIAIFVGLFGPSMSVVRQNARRQMCATQLQGLGAGAAAYASAYGGYLPYAGQRTGPFIQQPGKQRQPNTRHMFIMFKGGFVSSPRLVICPGRPDDRPMTEEDIQRCSDFPDPRNRSYDMQYMAVPVRVRLVANPSARPFLSDHNPVFEGDNFNPDVDPETANSTAHRGRGQNVVHLDGHVGWYKTPVLGPLGDNMWQIANLRKYSGEEAPTAATDVFMAP